MTFHTFNSLEPGQIEILSCSCWFFFFSLFLNILLNTIRQNVTAIVLKLAKLKILNKISLFVELIDILPRHTLFLHHCLLQLEVASQTLGTLDEVLEVVEHLQPSVLGVLTKALPFQNVFLVLLRQRHIRRHLYLKYKIL